MILEFSYVKDLDIIWTPNLPSLSVFIMYYNY